MDVGPRCYCYFTQKSKLLPSSVLNFILTVAIIISATIEKSSIIKISAYFIQTFLFSIPSVIEKYMLKCTIMAPMLKSGCLLSINPIKRYKYPSPINGTFGNLETIYQNLGNSDNRHYTDKKQLWAF